MNTTTCPQCGHEITIGEWAYCPHGLIRETTARRFDPIVVWQANDDLEHYSFPGQANEPVPDGYHKIELRTLAEADRFTIRMNALERRKMEATRDLNYQALDEQTKRLRDDIDARIRSNPRAQAMARQIRERVDKQKEQKRAKHRNLDPHFNIQVLAYDSGNRPSYSGPETGWRERKG
jgi:hypothetical protein